MALPAEMMAILADLAKPVDFTGQRKRKTRGGNHSNPEYYRWRKAVIERDGHKCTECGATEKLTAHHIKPWARHPEARYDLANGVTLCQEHHITKHPHMRWMNRMKRT
jgi:5-methylcytosine-specific restriction endonuclease McrA